MTGTARAIVYALGALAAAASAAAQQPVFDVDDFVSPFAGGTMFVSRVVTGFAAGLHDDFRPVGEDTFFVHLANSVYWSDFQLDYKRTEILGSGPTEVRACGCSPPIYFPTPPPRSATPDAPRPGSTDRLQFSWYRRQSGGAGRLPVVLRARAGYARQPIETRISSGLTGEELERRSGDEQSFGLDSDIFFKIRGRPIFGSVTARRTIRRGTTDDRAQTALAYTARFPVIPLREVLLRTTVTVAGVSGRGRGGVNVINPAFEAFWHHRRSKANFHFVWSPQTSRDGGDEWRTGHQIAVFADRAIFARLWGGSDEP